MNTRKRFKDYPLSFWFAVIATLTAAFLAISSYSRMINDDTALFKAAMIVIVLEGGLIVGMAAIKGHLQGTLKGWAFVMLWLIAGAEIFMSSMEIQHGINAAGMNAANYQQSSQNLGSVATGLSDATKALAACDKRYPRKNKDSVARAECRKPYETIVKSSAGAMPTDGNTAKYDADDAGELAQWQAVADTLNGIYEPEKPITWNQAAFYVMTIIMALFVLVKNFLWAKYAHDVALSDALSNDYVELQESELGKAEHQQAQATEEATHKPFGFAPAKPSPSSAAINRARMQTVENTQVHDRNTGNDRNTGYCNTGNDCNTGIRYTGTEAVKAAKVGHTVNCPVCGTSFVKANKWHLFCSNSRKKKADGTSCADTYYNAENPDRLRAIKRK